MYSYDGLPPNGLAFSCRKRARNDLQKTNDLAREAVGCNAGLGAHGFTALILRSCRNDVKIACQQVIRMPISERELKPLELGKGCRIRFTIIVAPVITNTPNPVIRDHTVAMLGKQGAQFLGRIDLHGCLENACCIVRLIQFGIGRGEIGIEKGGLIGHRIPIDTDQRQYAIRFQGCAQCIQKGCHIGDILQDIVTQDEVKCGAGHLRSERHNLAMMQTDPICDVRRRRVCCSVGEHGG